MLSVTPLAIGAGLTVVLALGAAAQAQTIDVNVPFAFHVRNITLHAGHYELDTDKSSGIVELRGEHGTTGAAMVMTEPASGKDPAGSKPALTFSRYEEGYRLTGVWDSATDGRIVVTR
jgi:alkylation response protein AidB-like acyl-CoA dehydrogenase